jgi:hypothetical protein
MDPRAELTGSRKRPRKRDSQRRHVLLHALRLAAQQRAGRLGRRRPLDAVVRGAAVAELGEQAAAQGYQPLNAQAAGLRHAQGACDARERSHVGAGRRAGRSGPAPVTPTAARVAGRGRSRARGGPAREAAAVMHPLTFVAQLLQSLHGSSLLGGGCGRVVAGPSTIRALLVRRLKCRLAA